MTTNSPLSLPFELATQPSQFLEQIQTAAEEELRSDILEVGTKPLGVALAGAKFVMENRELTVIFPGGIPRGARLMQDKLGRHLPKLVDGKTGRVLKSARVAKGAKTAAMTASAALIVLEGAHMISGHDNAQRLKKIEKDVAKLVNAQQSELKARLEAIYRYAREIAGPGSGILTDAERNEIGRLCLDLMQLRTQWREDFLFELNRIEPAKADLLTFKKDESYKRNLQARVDQAEANLESVQWMHFTLLLQMALSAKAGRVDRFLSVTLPDEVAIWKNLSDHANKRALHIAGKNAMPKAWDNTLNHLRSLATVWDLERISETI